MDITDYKSANEIIADFEAHMQRNFKLARSLGWREVEIQIEFNGKPETHQQWLAPDGKRYWRHELPDWYGNLNSAMSLLDSPEFTTWKLAYSADGKQFKCEVYSERCGGYAYDSVCEVAICEAVVDYFANIQKGRCG